MSKKLSSSDESEESSDENKMPDGIPAPPMPQPDLHNIIEEGPTYRTGKKESRKERRKRRKNKSKHPLDTVAMPGQGPKSSKGCCGCLFGGLFILLLLFVGLIFVVGWFGPGRFVKEGYEVVRLEEPNAIIETAPELPTFYIGQAIEYSADTGVPIAIAAQQVTLSGGFLDNVSVTAVKVTGSAGTTFAKDLEVFAVEFVDEGVSLSGTLKGRVVQNK